MVISQVARLSRRLLGGLPPLLVAASRSDRSEAASRSSVLAENGRVLYYWIKRRYS